MEERREQYEGVRTTLPILEVNGSIANFARYGSPIDRRDEVNLRYNFYPTWRSQLGTLVWFFVTGILSVVGSEAMPGLVIRGPLFSTNSGTCNLHLPLLVFIPAYFLVRALLRMFDSQYVVDARGVEAQIGLVSLRLRQPRLRYEDIRGVEPEQTLGQRMLGIGDVAIGSAMTDGVEILMQGVANPRGVQLLISGEMEKRMRTLTQGGNAGAYVAAVRGD